MSETTNTNGSSDQHDFDRFMAEPMTADEYRLIHRTIYGCNDDHPIQIDGAFSFAATDRPTTDSTEGEG